MRDSLARVYGRAASPRSVRPFGADLGDAGFAGPYAELGGCTRLRGARGLAVWLAYDHPRNLMAICAKSRKGDPALRIRPRNSWASSSMLSRVGRNARPK